MTGKGTLGSALRSMMSGPPPTMEARTGRKAEESVLMNPTRLRLFQTLCNRPCSHVRSLSRAMMVSAPSVLWHLRKLSENGLVRSGRTGNRTIYYPTEMLEEQDLPLLGMLSDERCSGAVRCASERPGISQSELSSASRCDGRMLARLARAGLLEVVRDGRHRRFYPGLTLQRRRDALDKRTKRFRSHVLDVMTRDGLKPEAVGPGREHLEVRVRLGTGAETLRFLRNPYSPGKQ
jgi:DNA-binding transcriptional ArsR family regulator